MAGNLVSLSSNGAGAPPQNVAKSGSERQRQKDVGDLGKALQAGDVSAAQSAVAALKTAAPTQNGRTDFANAVKALDQSVKTGDLKSAREAFANLQQSQQTQQKRAQQAPPPAAAPPGTQASRAPQQTAQSQRAGQNAQAQQVSEQAFITRQDLAAKGAQAKSGPQLGKNIDISV